MAVIFDKKVVVKTPITADKCKITIDGAKVGQAMNFQLTYQQQTTKRHTIGSEDAVVYGSYPTGQISIARLLTADVPGTFMSGKSWGCGGDGIVTFTTGDCNGGGGSTYSATGCMVTGFSLTANAEDLTVIDNITIEFLSLET